MRAMCSRLVQVFDSLGVSDREIAQALGYANASTLSRVRRGEAFVDVERLAALGDLVLRTGQHLDLNWVISGKGQGVSRPRHRATKDRQAELAQLLSPIAPTNSRLLLQSDNTIALGAVTRAWGASVRCAYIDPPYNNGDKYAHYSDNQTSDKWLAEMAQLLAAVRESLREDGSVWISIDDTEVHYLKVLCDRVFGRHNFVTSIVWERRVSRENRREFSRNHEYLIVYARNANVWKKRRNSLPITEDILSRYRNPDRDPRGAWQSVTATAQAGHGTESQFYAVRGPSGNEHWPPKGRCWVYTKERFEEEISKGNVWFGTDGRSVPRLKKHLVSRRSGVTPATLWTAAEVGTTASAKKHLKALFPDLTLFDTPKPEQLLARVIEISTDPGDLVLDPFLGSGTTAAVAHKMDRAYVGVEVGQHAESHCAQRLKKVVAGEPGGVSRAVGWEGGGDFTFFRVDP